MTSISLHGADGMIGMRTNHARDSVEKMLATAGRRVDSVVLYIDLAPIRNDFQTVRYKGMYVNAQSIASGKKVPKGLGSGFEYG